MFKALKMAVRRLPCAFPRHRQVLIINGRMYARCGDSLKTF